MINELIKMMDQIKYTVSVLIFTALSANVNAQTLSSKPALDTGSFSHWRHVYTPLLSNDGQYTLYSIKADNQPDVLVITSNATGWKTEISGTAGFYPDGFSNDSRYVFFSKTGDSLGMMDLRTKALRYLTNICGFQVAKNGNWVAYISKEANKLLTIYNTQTGKTIIYPYVTSYQFNDQGNEIALLLNKDGIVTLTEVNLPSGKTKTIETAKSISQVTFDPSGNKIAFIVEEKQDGIMINTLYCAQNGKAEKLVSGVLPGFEGFYMSGDKLCFSRNGDKILFRADTLAKPQLAPGAIKAISKLDVWNYKDRYDQATVRIGNARVTDDYYFVFDIANREIHQINKQEEDVSGNMDSFEDYVFVNRSGDSKALYVKESQPSYLVNTGTGQRTNLDANRNYNGAISPDEKYIVGFDDETGQYFSYEIATGRNRNLADRVPAPLCFKDPTNGYPPRPNGIAAWSSDEDAVYLYGNNDIWKVDLKENVAAINVTGGIGHTQGLVFSLVSFKQGPELIKKQEDLLLTVFSPGTKANGFYWMKANNEPEKLSMGSYTECIQRTGMGTFFDEHSNGMHPIKARDKNIYLIQRESANSSPNFYLTKDFKSFKPLSNVHPENNYNWLHSELITWELPDGKLSQGVLYKPENIDSSKKYPVIFNYYEKQSNRLNQYDTPDWTGGDINIPYFVSNGYLVFCPDIYYRQGYAGQGAVDALVSAAKCLTKLPYVDSTKLGIQGISFGGFETNFLVTHTNIFSAACSVSGMSDMISTYYQQTGANGPLFTELYQAGAAYGLGVTPYTHPELYIENSPVLFADKTTTPLLIIGGDTDWGVPITEDLQMYAALNRAGKKVWLLEYNNGGHGMAGNDAKDLTVRIKQFFDYYLKGATPPIWMTHGVPAATRAEDTGWEYDYSGAKP